MSMSMSPMMKESGADKVPGVVAAAAERPGFSRTCSLLSRYLKEKGSLGDLNLNLFLDASSSTDPDPGRCQVPNQFPTKTMNSFSESKLSMNLTNDAGKETYTAPMTICYAGNVIVFDDLPVERARAIVIMARRARILGAISPPLPATEFVPCDLPIARRSSLHRFLKKRKDRLMASVPYRKAESPTKAEARIEQAAAEADKY